MKGIIFTEFLEMVETRHGIDMVDRLIEGSDLESNGAYTSVGTYDHQELIQLVGELSRATSIPVPVLVRQFGVYLFERLASGYSVFLGGVQSAPEFLSRIEDHIHVEVKKLYPDAELPRFVYRDLGPGRLELTYYSWRPFSDLAEGLILGCIAHFKTPFELKREDLPSENGMTSARFTLSTMEESA